MTPEQLETLRAELKRWSTNWCAGSAYGAMWLAEDRNGEAVQIDLIEDYGDDLRVHIANLANAAPVLFDLVDQLRSELVTARRRIAEAEGAVIDTVETALAGQCGCAYAPCMHDKVRMVVAERVRDRLARSGL